MTDIRKALGVQISEHGDVTVTLDALVGKHLDKSLQSRVPARALKHKAIQDDLIVARAKVALLDKLIAEQDTQSAVAPRVVRMHLQVQRTDFARRVADAMYQQGVTLNEAEDITGLALELFRATNARREAPKVDAVNFLARDVDVPADFTSEQVAICLLDMLKEIETEALPWEKHEAARCSATIRFALRTLNLCDQYTRLVSVHHVGPMLEELVQTIEQLRSDDVTVDWRKHADYLEPIATVLHQLFSIEPEIKFGTLTNWKALTEALEQRSADTVAAMTGETNTDILNAPSEQLRDDISNLTHVGSIVDAAVGGETLVFNAEPEFDTRTPEQNAKFREAEIFTMMQQQTQFMQTIAGTLEQLLQAVEHGDKVLQRHVQSLSIPQAS